MQLFCAAHHASAHAMPPPVASLPLPPGLRRPALGRESAVEAPECIPLARRNAAIGIQPDRAGKLPHVADLVQQRVKAVGYQMPGMIISNLALGLGLSCCLMALVAAAMRRSMCSTSAR